MTASKLIKEVAKSDVPDLSPSLTSLEQLVSALTLAGTNVTINLNVTPASQISSEASQRPGTGDPSPIESSLTPRANDGGTGDPSPIESPLTPHANDGDMGDSSPIESSLMPRANDGDTGDSSPIESSLTPCADNGEAPADNPQGCHHCVCTMCRHRTICAPLSESEGLPGAVPNQPNGGSSEDNAVRWYTVTAGRRIGVFNQWATVAPLVVSVSGACFSRYPSRAAAEAAFSLALGNHTVRLIE